MVYSDYQRLNLRTQIIFSWRWRHEARNWCPTLVTVCWVLCTTNQKLSWPQLLSVLGDIVAGHIWLSCSCVAGNVNIPSLVCLIHPKTKALISFAVLRWLMCRIISRQEAVMCELVAWQPYAAKTTGSNQSQPRNSFIAYSSRGAS